MKGLLIVGCGPDGSGKTTQIARLATKLRSQGFAVTQTREPGGCHIGSQMRKILLDADNANLDLRAELLLYGADRAQHVSEIIMPALERGDIVLCDRFRDSTVAYQGARGHRLADIEWVNEFSTRGLVPDLTLLFDLPVEEGLRRSLARHSGCRLEARFELEEIKYHDRVREIFNEIANDNPHRYRVIDSMKSIEEVASDVSDVVDYYLLSQAIAANNDQKDYTISQL